MKVLLYPLWLLYRIWFYMLMLVPIIVLFPFIFVTILSEKTYPLFFKIARLWAKIILIGMGFRYSIEGDEIFEDGKSYMLVANHTSMTGYYADANCGKKSSVCVCREKRVGKNSDFRIYL